MSEAAQIVEVVVGEAGEIEAVMLPYAGRTPEGTGFCSAAHFFAAGLLVAAGIVAPFDPKWGRMVVCTPGFRERTRGVPNSNPPAPTFRLFFPRG